MSLNNPQDRQIIQIGFPGLVDNWKISSPKDANYNCIAWAGIKNDIWWWPVKDVDGVDWPFNLPLDLKLTTFIELFHNLKYELCDNPVLEPGHQKVAIYINESTQECTHAARQNIQGVWMSKLGEEWDIEHPDPFTIEGNVYGKVAALMKRKFP